MTDLICSIPGCGTTKIYARGWCSAHWRRWQKNGDPGGPAKRPWRVGTLCSVEGCDRPYYGNGFCNAHRLRLVRGGDLRASQPVGDRRVEDPSYVTVHMRLRRDRGPATAFVCDCGAPAAEWSYDKTDPDEQSHPEHGPYSVDPDRYHPKCKPCHVRFDARVKE